MHREADGQYKWILHIKDHFSKFSAFYALKSKESAEVVYALAHFISLFGPPDSLQCDNGREFKGMVIALLKHYGIALKNGRA